MLCPSCRQHVQEAGAYKWATEQARRFLHHEFTTCTEDGGANAVLGCLACVLDRLALRVSPETTLAAARQPWLERALALLGRDLAAAQADGAWLTERQAVLAGVARVERMAAIRLAAAAKALEQERAEQVTRAAAIRTELETATPAPRPAIRTELQTPKEKERATMKGNGRKTKKGKGKATTPKPAARPRPAAPTPSLATQPPPIQA